MLQNYLLNFLLRFLIRQCRIPPAVPMYEMTSLSFMSFPPAVGGEKSFYHYSIAIILNPRLSSPNFYCANGDFGLIVAVSAEINVKAIITIIIIIAIASCIISIIFFNLKTVSLS